MEASRISGTDSVRGRGFRLLEALFMLLFATCFVFLSNTTWAADHRDAPTVDGIPEGDITDVFAFLDPSDASKLVLIMNVNPFSVPAETPSYHFSTDLLYQFKIDNDGDAQEELVVQILFTNSGNTVEVFGPAAPKQTGAISVLPSGNPTVSGPTNQVLTGGAGGTIKVFAGQRDDPFVTDVGQLFRILTSQQDLFRGFTSPVLGPLRGRPVRSDRTSGVDAFGGFNVSSIQVELPKSMVKGNTSEINVWATVSRPLIAVNSAVRTGAAAQPETASGYFLQFERMGQQLINTIFMPAQLKDAFNAGIPQNDVAAFSALIPDSLTTTDNDGTGNTIAGRAAVLNASGLTSTSASPRPIHGAPLVLPGTFANTDKNLIRKAVLPDYLRLDLDVLPPKDAPPNNIGVIGKIPTIGLQDGRRPGDDATDILLLLSRQLADVRFPAGLKVGGKPVPGSGPLGKRNALDCATEGLAKFPQCTDRRVLAVLQGTDFIKPDAEVQNLDLFESGNEYPLSAKLPFLAMPHPLPGATGTVNFPPQM